MPSISPELLGFLAGLLTTFSGLPQIVKALRSRSMEDVSLCTLCICALGIALWIAYGIAKHSPSIVVWDSIALGISFIQIALKITQQRLSAASKTSNIIPITKHRNIGR